MKKTPQSPSPSAEDQQRAQDALHDRAERFIQRVRGAMVGYEKGEAQDFIREFCQVFEIDPLFSVKFEHRARRESTHSHGFIDAFFPGLLLVEMKSKGEDLERAYRQALDYLPHLKNADDLPQHILVSDFFQLHLYDLSGKTPPLRCALADLVQHIESFRFMLGYQRLLVARQEAANIEAAERLGDLHDALMATGYRGQDLQTLLVRVLFCLFADDTDLFQVPGAFYAALQKTHSDGSDVGGMLQRLFTRLNTDDTDPQQARSSNQRVDGQYAYLLHFPYVNGALFSARIADCDFDHASRTALLRCCELDWSAISPDIFGNLFQHIMHWEDGGGAAKTNAASTATAQAPKTSKRREFGAHYTSERNIRRAIAPLFLDDLKNQLQEAWGDKKKLQAFVQRLQLLQIFDPACGCGNFLVVAYRELRLLEIQALRALQRTRGAAQQYPACDVHQFHGLEIDPTSAEIARIALWLTDHQMNRLWQEGYKRIPLKSKANIVCANALQTDWAEVIDPKLCSFIVGNPPFLGKKEQNVQQKKDMEGLFAKVKGAGVLDYVSAWYVKALHMMQTNPAIKTAFVSTNSITQGEQVAVLWQPLLSAGLHLQFAHRTFKWSNEGKGLAAVHCVIIGMSMDKPKKCTIWDYSDDITGEGRSMRTKRINPYLVDAPFVAIQKRGRPICVKAPAMNYGSMPIDDGHLIVTEEVYAGLQQDPATLALIRPYTGGEEFLNNTKRYCLWLQNADFSGSTFALERVNNVRAFRIKSGRETTVKLGNTPHLFGEIRQPSTSYLLVPKVSSERRKIMPIGFLQPDTITSGSALIVPNASSYTFAIISSTMHMAWMRTVCGRLESRYQYSSSLVYNNYPWPASPTKAQLKDIEDCAKAVLAARDKHKGKSLAWLYNPETMPANVQDAHDALDEAVDVAYDYNGSNDDAARVAFLFARYAELLRASEVSVASA